MGTLLAHAPQSSGRAPAPGRADPSVQMMLQAPSYPIHDCAASMLASFIRALSRQWPHGLQQLQQRDSLSRTSSDLPDSAHKPTRGPIIEAKVTEYANLGMGHLQWTTWGAVDKLRSGYCSGKKDECPPIEDMSGNKVRES